MDEGTDVKTDFLQFLGPLLFTSQYKFDVLEEVRKLKLPKFVQEIHDLASVFMW